MRVDYEVTIDDLLAFNLYHFNHSPTMKRQVLLGQIIFSVMIIIGFGWIIYSNNVQGLPALIIAGIGALFIALFVAIYPRSVRSSVRKRIKKLAEEGRNTGMIGKQTMILAPDQITVTTEAGTSTYKWTAINKIETTAEWVFIYNTAISAFTIPRRAFPSDDACQTFIETVKAYHSGNAPIPAVA